MEIAICVSSVHTHGGGGRSLFRKHSRGAEKKHSPKASPTERPSRASCAFSSEAAMAEPNIQSINAVTLAVHDMGRSVRFYAALGFAVRYGGQHAAFTSLHAGYQLSQSDRAAGRSPLVVVGARDPSRIRR